MMKIYILYKHTLCPRANHHSASFFNELLQLLCLGREVFGRSACLHL